MAVKAKLETLDGVPADLAKEYEQVEENGKKHYRLTVEGAFLHDEDIGPALRARDHEKKQRHEEEKKRKELETQYAKLQEDHDGLLKGAIPKTDVERLEKSYQERMKKREDELTADRDSAFGTVKKLLVDNTAVSLAAKISDAPDLMLPIIQKRLVAEKTTEGYVLRVLDAEGKPSAATVEELEKEIRADKRFAKVIIGSRGSGGGASGGGGGGAGGGSQTRDWSKFDPNKASPKDVVAWQKWKKEMKAAGG
jgi:hypothetical protein